MLRNVALLTSGLVVALSLATPPAAACCHIYEIEETAGPCTARWEGSVFEGYSERVSLTCTAGDTTVAHEVEQCVGFCERQR